MVGLAWPGDCGADGTKAGYPTEEENDPFANELAARASIHRLDSSFKRICDFSWLIIGSS